MAARKKVSPERVVRYKAWAIRHYDGSLVRQLGELLLYPSRLEAVLFWPVKKTAVPVEVTVRVIEKKRGKR